MTDNPPYFFNILTTIASFIVGASLSITQPTPIVLAFDATNTPVVSETLQEKADRIAMENGISTTTLSNLIWSESRWQTDLTSPLGDRGLCQISKQWHPEISDEQAFNTDWCLKWTAEKIAQDKADMWTVCNCYSFVKTKIKDLPKMKDIVPNSKPRIGSVAIFKYKDGTKHIAYVKGLRTGIIEVEEANYKPCLTGSRDVSADDTRLIGFYYPQVE